MATVQALKNCFLLMGIEFLLPALWVSHSMTILAAKFTHRQWETTEWDWFYSRMILTEGNRSTGRETCHSTNISTTNSRWTLAFAMTVWNLQNHGTANYRIAPTNRFYPEPDKPNQNSTLYTSIPLSQHILPLSDSPPKILHSFPNSLNRVT